jgi:hypothetical protein
MFESVRTFELSKLFIDVQVFGLVFLVKNLYIIDGNGDERHSRQQDMSFKQSLTNRHCRFHSFICKYPRKQIVWKRVIKVRGEQGRQ